MEHVLPTAAEKLKLYQRVKELVVKNQGTCRFICIALYDAQQDLGFVNGGMFKRNNWSVSAVNYNYPDNCMENNFPELYRCKPKGKLIHEGWWTTGKKVSALRLKAINKMIAEVQAEIDSQYSL